MNFKLKFEMCNFKKLTFSEFIDRFFYNFAILSIIILAIIIYFNKK